MITLFK